MRNHLFNLCSNVAGPYAPFRRARFNIMSSKDHNNSVLIHDNYGNMSSHLYDFYSYFSGSNDEFSASTLHVMYEPGRSYPSIPFDYFTYQIVRIGDIHHLSNPLTLSYRFLQSNKVKSFFFNTTPHWSNLFQYLGFDCLFWSRLSESAQFSHLNLSFNHAEKKTGLPSVAYVGSLSSPVHPRRSWFASYALSKCPQVFYYKFCSHKEWFEILSRHHFVICPTLNSQISHNLYTPSLLGCVILTDLLAFPSCLDFDWYPIIQFESPSSLSAFLTQRPESLIKYWSNYFASADSLRSKILSIDSELGSYPSPSDFSSLCSDARKSTLLPRYCPLTTYQLLNIFEILQEIHRISKSTVFVTVNQSPLQEVFSLLLSLPRVVVNFAECFDCLVGESEVTKHSNILPVVRISISLRTSADFCFLNNASSSMRTSSEIANILASFNEFPCYKIHDQALVTSIIASSVDL